MPGVKDIPIKCGQCASDQQGGFWWWCEEVRRLGRSWSEPGKGSGAGISTLSRAAFDVCCKPPNLVAWTSIEEPAKEQGCGSMRSRRIGEFLLHCGLAGAVCGSVLLIGDFAEPGKGVSKRQAWKVRGLQQRYLFRLDNAEWPADCSIPLPASERG